MIDGYTIGGRMFDALVFGYYQGTQLMYAARTRNGLRLRCGSRSCDGSTHACPEDRGPPRNRYDCDFLHSFQSPMIAAAMSLTAVRSHLPERLFRSATIRVAFLAVPRWTFAVSQAIA
jgi:hypothetical protein